MSCRYRRGATLSCPHFSVHNRIKVVLCGCEHLSSLVLTFTDFFFLSGSICSGQVVKTGGTPKVPDCFQRTPKKLCIPEKAEILAVNVDSKGGSFSFMVPSVYN